MGRRRATSLRHLLPQVVLLSFTLMSAGCLAVAAGAGACSSNASGHSSPTGSGTTTTVNRESGPPYEMKQVELRLVDRSRRTPRNGTYAGAPTRTIVTLVSLPMGARLPPMKTTSPIA